MGVILLDVSNLYRELRGRNLLPVDLEAFRRWLEGEVGAPLEGWAYTVPIGGAHEGFLKALRAMGWRVRQGYAARREEGFLEKGVDVSLAVDGVLAAREGKSPLVLVSGDGDLLPMVERAKEFGSQVVVAQFSSSLSHHLREAAHRVLPLEEAPWEGMRFMRRELAWG